MKESIRNLLKSKQLETVRNRSVPVHSDPSNIHHSWKNIPGPETILRKKLQNGIISMVRENPVSRTAVISASIPCGSYLDPAEKTGLADFTANCLNNGTRTHDFESLSELLEVSGASLGISSGPRAYTIHGTCLSEDLPMLLNLLKEILEEPAFPEDHVEIHRARVLSAREIHLHDPESMANEQFDRLLFGEGHPYGRPEFGTAEEINSITREDLFQFHRRYISPQNMIIAISGGINAEKMQEMCESILGSWMTDQETIDPAAFFPSVPAPDKTISSHIEIPEKSEAFLLMGTMAPRRNSPEFLKVMLGNSILGEFGMMGRIGKAVRDKHGLAYYAGSSLTALSYGGCWTFEAGTNAANLEKTADLIISELKRFTSEKVSREELEDVKSYYIGSLPLTMEGNSGTASLLLMIENQQLGLDYMINLPEKVNRITPDDILETAQKWLDPEKLIRVTAGTAEK